MKQDRKAGKGEKIKLPQGKSEMHLECKQHRHGHEPKQCYCLERCKFVDPRGRPRSDHYFSFRTWCLYFRPSTLFQNLSKQNKFQGSIVITSGGTMDLTEWIIDGTQVLSFLYSEVKLKATYFSSPSQILKEDIAIMLSYFFQKPKEKQKTSFPFYIVFNM